MKKIYLIAGAILIIIISILIIYVLRTPTKTSPVGLWAVEKSYSPSYDKITKQLQFIEDTSTDFSHFFNGGPMYMEYTKDGKWCISFDGMNCNQYDGTYTIEKNIMKIHQEGATITDEKGLPVEGHYLLEINNGKLELTWEVLDNNSNQWLPQLKYILKPVSR